MSKYHNILVFEFNFYIYFSMDFLDPTLMDLLPSTRDFLDWELMFLLDLFKLLGLLDGLLPNRTVFVSFLELPT